MYNLSDSEIRGEIDRMFLRYDTDRSNTLDSSELAPFLNEVFEKTNYPMKVNNIQEATQLLHYIDINSDGVLSKSEIFNVFKYLIQSSADINGVKVDPKPNQGNQQIYGGGQQNSYGQQNLYAHQNQYL